MCFFCFNNMLGGEHICADGSRLGLGTKETVAIAVLKDAWQNGHRCVELRRDGRRVIFFCTLCGTRCYNDTVLSDHLNGNQHTRRAASVLSSICGDESCLSDMQTGSFGNKEKPKEKGVHELMNASSTCVLGSESFSELPASSVEFIGQAQVFIKHSETNPRVKAVWCQWLGLNVGLESHVKSSDQPAYALVIFPYSDAIGRRGEWKPAFPGKNGFTELKTKFQQELLKKSSKSFVSEDVIDLHNRDSVFAWMNTDTTKVPGERGNSLFVKDLSQVSFRKALKKRRLNLLERFCFICHQQMLPGKDMAGLLNLSTGQMICNSRNTRGAFHIFHSSCLIDWILLCKAKFSSPAADENCRLQTMRGQVGTKRRGRRKSAPEKHGPVFCPECQGTGIQVDGHQLELPRYRLAQVFEWLLEMIQARRSWMEHSEGTINSRGLFLSSDSSADVKPVPLGVVQFYAAGNLERLVARSRFMSKANA